MNFKTSLKLITVSCLVLTGLVTGQVGEKAENRNQLERLRHDINEYRKKVQEEKKKETHLLDSISRLDQEIDLTHKLISELKNEDGQKSKLILKIGRTLRTTEEELTRLQQIYSNRLVNFYKYGRMKDVELLLTARSFNQTLTWLKFQKLVAQNDQRNYNNILSKKQKIETEKNRLKTELIEQRKILTEKEDEEKILKNRSHERNRLLSQVQQNKQVYIKKLKEYENAAQEIQRLINQQEDKRLSLEREGIIQVTDFPRLKGRMIWPTNGTIINHFGLYKHPKWRDVVTENIGIDIQADQGQEVRSVAKGVVTGITWMRGRGNIVLINHMGGYFTVYTHLSEILVRIDESVNEGQVIGSVGDTGSLRGPMLHFEIWKNKELLNPEDWLGR
ncbi:MAG: murein hydrolase activator EnvC family protein [Candidatus Zhuqueibacterota bacterium]